MMSVPSSVNAKDCLRLLAKGLFGLWLSPKIVEGFQAMLKTAWATSLR